MALGANTYSWEILKFSPLEVTGKHLHLVKAIHFVCIYSSKVTTPQDAHERLVLQVRLGSNTIKFSGIHRLNLILYAFYFTYVYHIFTRTHTLILVLIHACS